MSFTETSNILCMSPMAIIWLFSGGSELFYVLNVLCMMSCFHITDPKVHDYHSSLTAMSCTVLHPCYWVLVASCPRRL